MAYSAMKSRAGMSGISSHPEFFVEMKLLSISSCLMIYEIQYQTKEEAFILRGKEKETLIQDLLVEQYEKYYRMAYSYVRSESDAQDIVQEAAYKAIYHAGKLKKPEFTDTWICRIVINEAINYVKKNKKPYVDLEEADVGREAVYEDVDLKAAIDKLPPKDKTIIILRFFEDMSLEQIAQICGENINTVKSRLYRTLKKLKLELAEEGILYE